MPTWLYWVLALWILPQVLIPLVGVAASYLGAFDEKPKPKALVRIPPRVPGHSSFPPPAFV